MSFLFVCLLRCVIIINKTRVFALHFRKRDDGWRGVWLRDGEKERAEEGEEERAERRKKTLHLSHFFISEAFSLLYSIAVALSLLLFTRRVLSASLSTAPQKERTRCTSIEAESAERKTTCIRSFEQLQRFFFFFEHDGGPARLPADRRQLPEPGA